MRGDGNLIVAVDGMSFKVYAAILERRSSVSWQLLGSSQAKNGSAETVEDRHVVWIVLN